MSVETYRANGHLKFENDHGGLYELTDDDHTQYALISSGSGAPGSTPGRVGLLYVDTTNQIAYLSKGTSSSADWVEAAALAMTTAQRDAVGSPATGLQTFNADTYTLDGYDGQRWRGLSRAGYLPTAYPVNHVANAAFTTALNLPALSGSIAIPMRVVSHMLFASVSVRNTDTTGVRNWCWDLYAQRRHMPLTELVAFSAGAGDSFTASAASTRTLNEARDLAIYLAPGIYWLVIQNVHQTNTFGLGSTAASSAFAPHSAQTKTTGSDNSVGLDLSDGWSAVTANYAVCMNGYVFGQSATF